MTEVSGSRSYKLIRRIKVLMESLLFPQLFSLLSSFVHLLSLISEVPIGNGLILDLGANPRGHMESRTNLLWILFFSGISTDPWRILI